MAPVRADLASLPAFVIERAQTFVEIARIDVKRFAANVALENDLAMLSVEHQIIPSASM